MKLCFIVCVDPEIEKTQMFGIRYMPVWVYTLAAHLRVGTNLDLSLSDTRIDPESKIPEADFYFYSALNQDVPHNVELRSKLAARFPKAKHLIGGPATSSLRTAGQLGKLKDFDGVFIGEGEAEVVRFLDQASVGTEQLVYEAKGRFDLSRSLPMDFTLLKETHHLYYGGVLEVSRGCPFLCEFCDIRTLPDNNRANNRPIPVLIEELDQFRRLGITNVLFACDNFIGDPNWATSLVDAIADWKKDHDYGLKAYTWLTINISNHPKLIEKMKAIGFDMFFIGIESFGTEQLLETAKVQNTKFDLPAAIRSIQTYGIVVVAGLIFGFDTDTDETVDEALDGILASGLISGDPTLLTALAGTPLYKRMQLAGRLRDGKVALGGMKYSTNIRYLREKKKIVADYVHFVKTFNSVSFQLKRYRVFLENLKKRDGERRQRGYISPSKILGLILRNPRALKPLVDRLGRVLISPRMLLALCYGFILTVRSQGGSLAHFSFWLFNWTNSLVKYSGISEKDFDIESIDGAITEALVLPPGYLDDASEPIPLAKIKAQRQFTAKSLRKLLVNE